jgi:hypothetical protein
MTPTKIKITYKYGFESVSVMQSHIPRVGEIVQFRQFNTGGVINSICWIINIDNVELEVNVDRSS